MDVTRDTNLSKCPVGGSVVTHPTTDDVAYYSSGRVANFSCEREGDVMEWSSFWAAVEGWKRVVRDLVSDWVFCVRGGN